MTRTDDSLVNGTSTLTSTTFWVSKKSLKPLPMSPKVANCAGVSTAEKFATVRLHQTNRHRRQGAAIWNAFGTIDAAEMLKVLRERLVRADLFNHRRGGKGITDMMHGLDRQVLPQGCQA